MVQNYFQKRNLSIGDKILAFDFILLFSVLLLGVISLFAMYSSERGTFSYHTQSHLYRFSIFFLFFIIISFVKINYIFITRIYMINYIFFIYI